MKIRALDTEWGAVCNFDLDVLSSYEHACNCILPAHPDKLYWISTSRNDFAPGVLVLSTSVLPDALSQGAKVRLTCDNATDELTLSVWDTALKQENVIARGLPSAWKEIYALTLPAVSRADTTAALLTAAYRAARSFLNTLGSTNSPFHPAYHHAESMNRSIAQTLTTYGKQAATALATTEAVQFCNAAKHMIGLGFGLTPSGDDFLVGALATTAYLNGSFSSNLAESQWKELCSQTTRVSQHYLHEAYWARFAERITDLLDQLFAHPAQSQEAVSNLVSFGATSGTDVLAGIVYTLESFLYALNSKDLEQH